MSAELRFEDLQRQAGPSVDRPLRIETASAPVFLRYFDPSGVFAQGGITVVHQNVDVAPASDFEEDQDTFVLLDAAVGFRLPARRGILSLEGRNLLDEDFLFEQEDIQTSEPAQPRFIPARAFLARATLSF